MLLRTVWQIVWGFPQTLLGSIVFLTCARRPHFAYHGVLATVWRTNAGLSLGPFVFVNRRKGSPDDPGTRQGDDAPPGVDAQLLAHEYGHTVQSLMLGPLYLIAIGLPSIIWLRAPYFVRMRRREGISYYSFYTERWADRLGEKALGVKLSR